MKILFAADVSFNEFHSSVSFDDAFKIMGETAEEFRKADFSILNLENIMGTKENYTPIVKTGPNLISDESFMAFLDILKPSAVGLANNHVYDYGYEAFRNTTRLLDERGIKYAGAGDNIDEAYEPVIFSDGTTKAAVYCICENEFGIASLSTPGAAGYSVLRTTKAIINARKNGILPIIFFHGGNEHNPFPSPEKLELYRHFADIGAAAVIAMHTHCPQGYEIYNGTPIIYSMGNFFFPEKNPALRSWSYGYMVMLDIDDDKAEIEILPYKFDFGYHNLLHSAEKDGFIKYLEVISSDFNDEKKMNAYYDAWTHIAGFPCYLNFAKFTSDMMDCDKEKIKEFKNLFSCEAHNELIKRCARLIYDNRVDESKEYEQYIRNLQNMITE